MLASVLLAALNHLLEQAEWARRRLLPHAGQVAELQLPLGTVRCLVGNDGYLAESAGDAIPALTLTVPGQAVAAALEGSDAAMKHVRIAGNAEFGEALGFALRNLEWDAEADLARVVGDVAAPRLFRSLHGAAEWHRQALQRTAANLRDYLVLERPTLVSREALQEFSTELTRFRDDLARLEKRIDRFVAKTPGSRRPG